MARWLVLIIAIAVIAPLGAVLMASVLQDIVSPGVMWALVVAFGFFCGFTGATCFNALSK